MIRLELLKTAKPILFNTEMVRAILDGRKTVTRRVVKPQHLRVLGSPYHQKHPEFPDKVLLEKLCQPPYQPGDILYVREAYCWCYCWDCGMNSIENKCEDNTAEKFYNEDKREYGCYGYKASFYDNEMPFGGRWRPSIHMPKEAARIFLRVTNVRVERLQDIDDNSVVAEGLEIGDLFDELWDSTIKKSDLDRYGWNADPWVWIIEFERVEVEDK